MPATLRRFIDLNRRVSRWERSVVSRLVPGCAADGTVDFRDRVLPSLIRPGMRVLDFLRDGVLPSLIRPAVRVLEVGVAKERPISPAMKQRYGLGITGLDVSA